MKGLKMFGYWAIGWILLVINFLMGFLLHKLFELDLGCSIVIVSFLNLISAGIGALIWGQIDEEAENDKKT
jgi:hypothetical protein